MEQWSAQHRAFVVEAYFKNGDSAVTTQRLFRIHFNIPRHGRVPRRNTIKEWVQNFRENASALKRKPQGRIPTVRTPENVDKVRMAIVKSPRRLVRRHSAAIGLSDCSVRRILHKDLNFRPYKNANVQELSDCAMWLTPGFLLSNFSKC
jgi:transposase